VVPTSDRVWAREIVVRPNHHPGPLIAATESDRRDGLSGGPGGLISQGEGLWGENQRIFRTSTKVRLVKLGNLLKSLVESEKIESASELKGGSNPRGRSLRLAPVLGGELS